MNSKQKPAAFRALRLILGFFGPSSEYGGTLSLTALILTGTFGLM
jgi:hypothetical protein